MGRSAARRELSRPQRRNLCGHGRSRVRSDAMARAAGLRPHHVVGVWCGGGDAAGGAPPGGSPGAGAWGGGERGVAGGGVLASGRGREVGGGGVGGGAAEKR